MYDKLDRFGRGEIIIRPLDSSPLLDKAIGDFLGRANRQSI